MKKNVKTLFLFARIKLIKIEHNILNHSLTDDLVCFDT